MRVALAYMGRENYELEYISAACRQQGHEIHFAYDPGSFTSVDNIFHVPALARYYDRTSYLLSQLREGKPGAVYFHVYSAVLGWALELAEKIKTEQNIPVIFGGLHPTMAPESVIALPQVDFVIVGEGEVTLPELLATIEKGAPPKDLPGIWLKENERARYTGHRPLIEDLDALPLPDKELFAKEVNAGDDYMLFVGRGCPGRCTYCQEGILRRLFGAKYFRRRSIEPVLRELEIMKERYGFSKVFIFDPIFFTPKKWVLEFLEGYRRRISTPFRCYGQLKWIDRDIAVALKKAGCYGVEFGLQTANDQIRKDILDRPETLEDARRAFALCDEIGLRYDIDHIFGLPGESEADYEAAARLYAECRLLNRVKVHMLVYFPGAPILETARRMGMADEEDVLRAQRGEVGDICRVGSVRREEVEGYARRWKNFYKLMPLLGRRFGLFAVDKKWNRVFGKLPGPVVIALQLLVAAKGRDHRFWIYIKYVLFRIRRHRRFLQEVRSTDR